MYNWWKSSHFQIYDGLNELGTLLWKNDTNPGTLVAQSGRFFIKFSSDAVLSGPGFKAEFSIDCPTPGIDPYSVVHLTDNSTVNAEDVPTQFQSEFDVTCAEGYIFLSEYHSSKCFDVDMVYDMTCIYLYDNLY